MLRRSITLMVWALLAWMLVALGLRLGGPSAAVNAPEAASALAPAPSLSRLFGASAAPVEVAVAPADARLRLIGVVAPGDARQRGGVALLSIDGGPPKAFRVGELVDGNLRLLKVSARSAALGEGDAPRLELPLQSAPPAAAAIGQLPAPTGLAPAMPQMPQAEINAPPPMPLRTQGADPGPAEQPRAPGDENPRSRDESGPRRPGTLPTR